MVDKDKKIQESVYVECFSCGNFLKVKKNKIGRIYVVCRNCEVIHFIDSQERFTDFQAIRITSTSEKLQIGV